ncbi:MULTISPECIES: SsrA-binding protein SmpB [unclassified Frondihabitans]|jgi:SsrA-binding protein|uniref:SsrA-binding protein SmpB n=1 Tax=unclassified Frondihabitans TaxID=2626248 RepID=UPI0006FB3FB5|nr:MULTISPECIES: SsrA-binding protein SmpB [unclassified Frondihabitans]KQQ27773.1 SsrA-binding protein [Frondihabitans sp. Leaf304]MBF4576212.1 SsrA-binding protein SmpB [Frondihabitans sp. VKM Ac-2883]RPE74464.1 SsrA-binding protein [Frondihabitans sp. PhB153]RPF02893.1 SsrA-binding protein [Frondihabitans sp. PhB161]
MATDSSSRPISKKGVSDRDRGEKVVASNRRARHDYLIDDTYEAGIVLWGTEVKALRQGRASLIDGYAFIEGGEIWLDAVHIPEYTEGTWNNHAPRRKRKLLMHKQQIIKISHKTKEGGYTIVPLRIYFADGRAKVEIAVAKGKREYDKRQTLRERTDRREADRAMSARRNMGD